MGLWANKMFIAGVDLDGTLADPVSMTVEGALSEDEGGTLIPSKNMGASLTMSCLLSEVTIGASGDEVGTKSYVTVTSNVGLATRVPSTEQQQSFLSHQYS